MILPNDSLDPTKKLSPELNREMVYARTRELALLAGRPPHQINQRDYNQARLEVTGVTDSEHQEKILSRVKISGVP